MKSRKELLEEIMDDMNKNQVSRELELIHVEGYLMKKAVKNKDKIQRKAEVEAVSDKAVELKEEMEARKNLMKIVKKMLS